MGYQQEIREEIARQGKVGIDPRHVEGYMRLAHPILSGLSRAEFNREVRTGIDCVELVSSERAEQNAKSFGL